MTIRIKWNVVLYMGGVMTIRIKWNVVLYYGWGDDY